MRKISLAVSSSWEISEAENRVTSSSDLGNVLLGEFGRMQRTDHPQSILRLAP